MNLSVGAKTDPGRRPNNEDQLLVLDVRRHNLRADGVLVIADGMGGRNFGERAAAAAVETIGETLAELLDSDRDPAADLGDALGSALRKANSKVYELSGSDEESRGMGTTCVAAVVEGNRVYVAHAGDSRAYRWRAGEIMRLTDDHSYVAEQVRAGVLTEENAKRSRFRNVITRAVGIEPTISPDVSDHDVQTGDALLLCTDGLTNMVAEDEIAEILGHATSAQAAADQLVHLANTNGGKDNITAIVARLEVGTRTQRMRADDFARVVPPAAAQPSRTADEDIEYVPENTSAILGDDAYAQPLQQSAPRGRGRLIGTILLAIIALVFLVASLILGNRFMQVGYRLQPGPPFAVKPPAPPPPVPPDLAHVTYGTPAPINAVPPVSGETLTWDLKDNSLTAISLAGNVLVLTPSGQTLYKYPLAKRHFAAATPGSPSPAMPPAQRLHAAKDPQGNLYVSDTQLRTIEKYKPNGDFLRYIAQGQLKQPAAIAVDGNGAVYVVDAQRLVAIPAKPPASK